MLMEKRLYSELIRLGVHPDCIDAEALMNAVSEHMDRGLNGETGSMMMIPAYLYGEGSIIEGEPVAVIDAGGTNLRAASVAFTKEGPRVLRMAKSAMPGTSGRITADEMFDEFVARILPFMPDSGSLALCFSYAFEAMPDGEARIITMSKEVEVEDAPGTFIVDGMKKAFLRAGYAKEPHITVVNDTAAVLYSALASGEREAVGFILGTGMNTAYFEKTSRITKIEPVEHDRMMINMESAYFSDAPAGPVDLLIDSRSRNRGEAVFEKMLSGAYLGKVAAACAEEFASAGFLSENARKLIPDEFRIADMSCFLKEGSGPVADMCGCGDDEETLRELFRMIEIRAGKMTSALVAAVIKRIKENGFEGPVPVAVNGSTVLLNELILGSFTEGLRRYAGEDAFRIVTTENDTLFGSAAAAFLG